MCNCIQSRVGPAIDINSTSIKLQEFRASDIQARREAAPDWHSVLLYWWVNRSTGGKKAGYPSLLRSGIEPGASRWSAVSVSHSSASHIPFSPSARAMLSATSSTVIEQRQPQLVPFSLLYTLFALTWRMDSTQYSHCKNNLPSPASTSSMRVKRRKGRDLLVGQPMNDLH